MPVLLFMYSHNYLDRENQCSVLEIKKYHTITSGSVAVELHQRRHVQVFMPVSSSNLINAQIMAHGDRGFGYVQLIKCRALFGNSTEVYP